MDLHEVAGVLAPSASRIRMRQGKVLALAGDGTNTVTIAGSTAAVPNVKCFTSATPSVGGGVWLMTDGADLIAVGVVGHPGATGPAGPRPQPARSALRVPPARREPPAPRVSWARPALRARRATPARRARKATPGGLQLGGPPGVLGNAAGADGDWCLNTTNGDAYLKFNGVWYLQCNIRGPQGATGATGAKGEKGDTGYGIPGSPRQPMHHWRRRSQHVHWRCGRLLLKPAPGTTTRRSAPRSGPSRATCTARRASRAPRARKVCRASRDRPAKTARASPTATRATLWSPRSGPR